jgi:hypothetical protein
VTWSMQRQPSHSWTPPEFDLLDSWKGPSYRRLRLRSSRASAAATSCASMRTSEPSPTSSCGSGSRT